jgi:hypothetical protein
VSGQNQRGRTVQDCLDRTVLSGFLSVCFRAEMRWTQTFRLSQELADGMTALECPTVIGRRSLYGIADGRSEPAQ